MALFLLNGRMAGSENSARNDISTGKWNRSGSVLWPRGQVKKQGVCPRSQSLFPPPQTPMLSVQWGPTLVCALPKPCLETVGVRGSCHQPRPRQGDSLGDHGAVPELRCLQDYFSTTDIVSHWCKNLVTTITLRVPYSKVTTLAWEITCPNKTEPLMQVQKEQNVGWERGQEIVRLRLCGAQMKQKSTPYWYSFTTANDKKQHFHWRKMKPMNWLCSQKVPCSLSSVNFGHFR